MNFEKTAEFLARPDITPFLIYLETGRDVRFSPSLQVFSPHFAESPPPSPPPVTEVPLPVFSPEETPQIYYGCNADPDLAALLTRPLDWDLTQGDPAVLILHTHSTESYTQGSEPYAETSRWRTTDENYNMLSIGRRVGQLLAEAGIGVIQDTALHDYPSYNGSYVRSRKSVSRYLEEYPSIRLVLDLHRDASEGTAQMRPVTRVEGQACAGMMLVLGTNHEDFETNLALGLKLHALLERQAPGITRPLQLRGQRFNQDLSKGALLVEMGAAGNTHAEALAAADQLAAAIIALAKGSA